MAAPKIKMAATPKLVAVADEATAVEAVSQLLGMDAREPQSPLSEEEKNDVIALYREAPGAFDAHLCRSQITQARIDDPRKVSLQISGERRGITATGFKKACLPKQHYIMTGVR